MLYNSLKIQKIFLFRKKKIPLTKTCKKQKFSHEKTVIFLSSGHGFTLPKKDKKQDSQALSYSVCQNRAPYGLHKIIFILQAGKFFVL